MDRRYIENQSIVERYLAGDLTVREAREFEQYCRDNPDAVKSMPIPVRLKARLARHPLQDSESGMFEAIPSSATHAASEAGEALRANEQRPRFGPSYVGTGTTRLVVLGLALAFLGTLAGLVGYAMKASALSRQLKSVQRDAFTLETQPPSSVQIHRVQLVRGRPEHATLVLGWPTPPQLLDVHVDVSEGKYSQFQITIDKVGVGRLMQIRRVARDSNRELRFGLNSSAFGPGEYLFKVDGYTWRGQTEEVGWLRVELR